MKKTKKIFRAVGLGLLLTLSLCAVAYPAFSSWYSQRHHSTVNAQYQDHLEKTGDEAVAAAFAAAREYNAGLASGEYSPLDYKANGYYELLNLTGNGIIGFVAIPKIDVALTVYHGTTDDVLRKGVGHMEQTSLPTGGPSTHAVLSAHTGTTDQRLFTDLALLEIGDIFYVTVLDKQMAYRVDQIVTVLPEDISQIQIVEGADLVTLATCTPYGINSHRLLVRGRRIELEEAERIGTAQEDTPAPTRSLWTQHYIRGILWGLGGAVLLVLMLLLPGRILHKKRE